MVLGSVGRGDLTMLATLHQAGLLTVILRSQKANNSQWCLDWYGAYIGGEVTNPTGPKSGTCCVGRGDSWYFHASFARPAFRGWNLPGNSDGNLGFRLVLSFSP